LAVGDIRFQQRCMARIRQLRDRGVSILFVTHDLEAAKRLCDEIHVLDRGRLMRSGPPDAIANWYLAYMTQGSGSGVRCPGSVTQEKDQRELRTADRESGATAFVPFRHGDGGGRIARVQLLSPEGWPLQAAPLGEACRLRFEAEFHVPVEAPILGFYIRDRLGTDVIGVNTHQEGITLPSVQPGDRIVVDFVLPLRLRPGHYSINPALAYNQDEMRYLDWIDNALVFKIVDRQPGRVVFGLVQPEVQVEYVLERQPAPAAA
jgi:lipopolysaccharide transport system ATP-binding protein